MQEEESIWFHKFKALRFKNKQWWCLNSSLNWSRFTFQPVVINSWSPRSSKKNLLNLKCQTTSPTADIRSPLAGLWLAAGCRHMTPDPQQEAITCRLTWKHKMEAEGSRVSSETSCRSFLWAADTLWCLFNVYLPPGGERPAHVWLKVGDAGWGQKQKHCREKNIRRRLVVFWTHRVFIYDLKQMTKLNQNCFTKARFNKSRLQLAASKKPKIKSCEDTKTTSNGIMFNRWNTLSSSH